MNHVTLLGRFTRDTELRYTQAAEPMAVLHNTIAVNRIKKDESDFINVVAFGQTAENIQKFFSKGAQILIEGHIQTGKYDKAGSTIYTTDVIIDRFHFVGKKEDNTPTTTNPKQETSKQLTENDDDDDLPF